MSCVRGGGRVAGRALRLARKHARRDELLQEARKAAARRRVLVVCATACVRVVCGLDRGEEALDELDDACLLARVELARVLGAQALRLRSRQRRTTK